MSLRKTQVRDFTDLLAWKLANEIRIDAYRLAKLSPEEEKFNLASQLKRSSASIAANIAVGYGRFSYQENIQFCRQARGSLEETRDHLMFIATVYPNIKTETLIEKAIECRKIINGYISYLKGRKLE